MISKRYALYALETLLGQPEHLARKRDGNAGTVAATWRCGCAAAGRSTAALEIRTCGAHRALFEGG